MPTRVLLAADSYYLRTGLSRVAGVIGRACLKAGMEVFQLGFQDPRENREVEKWAGIVAPWKVIPTQKSVKDNYGNETFTQVLSQVCPDVVVVVADPWNIDHILVNSPVPTILLVHVEGAPFPISVINSIAGSRRVVGMPQVLLHANAVVTPGPFARKCIQERMTQHARIRKRSEEEIKSIIKNTSVIIPDMIDTNVFKPIDKRGLKQKLFKVPEDAFIIGFFGRQNPRKGLPYAIKAFSQWRDRPKNAYLYLHTAVKDAHGWNIVQLVSDYRVNDRVIIDSSIKVGGGCSDEVLNMFYNACFPMGTPVRCEDGYRPIENILTGDVVLSAKGNLKKVVRTYIRKYTGPLTRVTTNRSQKGTLSTPNHKFKVLKGDGIVDVPAEELTPGNVLVCPHTKAIDGPVRSTVVSEMMAYDVLERFVDKKTNAKVSWDGVTFDVTEKPGEVPHIVIDGMTYITSVVESVEKTPDTELDVYNIEVEDDHSYVVAGAGVANCSLKILPSAGEGAALTVLEAGAAGIPCITTNYAETPNYMGDACEYIDPVGFWVEPGTNIERAIPDVDQLIRKMRMLYSNDKRREELGLAARARVVEHFDENRVGKVWPELIEQVANEKRRQGAVSTVEVVNKKKICFAGSYFLPDLIGGGEITYYEILKWFRDQGWEPYCLVCRDGISEENVILDGIRITRIPKSKMKDATRAYFEKVKPDVMITTLIDKDFTLQAMRSAKEFGSRVVYYEQFYNTITKRYRDVMMSTPTDIVPWAKQVLSLCDDIYSNGNFVKEAMRTLVGFNSKVLHPYVDMEKCAVEKTGDLVTMVNPDPGKGGRTLLGVAERLKNRKFLAVKVSSKNDYRELDAVSKSLENLEVIDFQKDPREIYKKTKLLLMPTIVDETFGRVIIEAQLNGIPVIGRDVGGISDTMGAGGILIGKHEDDDVWAAKVEEVLSNETLYAELSAKARENVKRFDFNKELAQLFSDLTSKEEETIKNCSNEVVCVYPRDFHGVVSALKGAAKLFPERVSLIEVDLYSKVSDLVDQLVALNPKRVVLGAWMPLYKTIISGLKKRTKSDIVVAWFSSFSQMEFTTNELPAFAEVRGLLKAGTIDGIWMSAEEDARTLGATEPKIKFYPCPLHLKETKHTYNKEEGKIKVSMFFTPGPRKNISNQLVACSLVPGLELHTNGTSRTTGAASLIQSLGLKVIEHGWLERDGYEKMMAAMDVGLQVTHAETFNYVAADHFAQGTPVVASRAVPVVAWDKRLEGLLVQRADSPEEIAEKIKTVAAEREKWSPIVKESVKDLAERHNKMLEELLFQ